MNSVTSNGEMTILGKKRKTKELYQVKGKDAFRNLEITNNISLYFWEEV